MTQIFAAADKLRCVEREIACMEAISADYRAQAAAEKPDLFASAEASHADRD